MYNHTTCRTSSTCALMTTILECVLTTVKKLSLVCLFVCLHPEEKCTFPTGPTGLTWQSDGYVMLWHGCCYGDDMGPCGDDEEGAARCPVWSLPFSPPRWSVGTRSALRTLRPLWPAPSDPACASRSCRAGRLRRRRQRS